MPEISRFLGVVIQMYRDEHPPPHFHASYGEFSAQISIRSQWDWHQLRQPNEAIRDLLTGGL